MKEMPMMLFITWIDAILMVQQLPLNLQKALSGKEVPELGTLELLLYLLRNIANSEPIGHLKEANIKLEFSICPETWAGKISKTTFALLLKSSLQSVFLKEIRQQRSSQWSFPTFISLIRYTRNIEFNTREDMLRAIEKMDNTDLQGDKIYVEEDNRRGR